MMNVLGTTSQCDHVHMGCCTILTERVHIPDAFQSSGRQLYFLTHTRALYTAPASALQCGSGAASYWPTSLFKASSRDCCRSSER